MIRFGWEQKRKVTIDGKIFFFQKETAYGGTTNQVTDGKWKQGGRRKSKEEEEDNAERPYCE